MIRSGSGPKVLVAAEPIDFRKGVHGLVAMVAQALEADPYCGDVFVFRSKRADRMRLLTWDGTGLVVLTKWLEAGRFAWPPPTAGVVRLSAVQFALLVEGLEWSRASPRVVRRPVRAG